MPKIFAVRYGQITSCDESNMYVDVVFWCKIDYCFYERSFIYITLEARNFGMSFTETYGNTTYLSGCGTSSFPFSANKLCNITTGNVFFNLITQNIPLGGYYGATHSKLNNWFKFYNFFKIEKKFKLKEFFWIAQVQHF